MNNFQRQFWSTFGTCPAIGIVLLGGWVAGLVWLGLQLLMLLGYAFLCGYVCVHKQPTKIPRGEAK